MSDSTERKPSPSRQGVDAVLLRLRRAPPKTEREVDRVYRRLLRETHPDHSGDDGALFLYVQEEFAQFREEWMAARARRQAADAVDPTALLVDLGLPQSLAPRPALFAALYRFRSLGLANYRVRSRPSLRRRNATVVRTVVAWAYEYDERFVGVFHRFLLHHGHFALAERHAPLYFLVRKMILKGMDGLIRYQDHHRPATADIARDTIRYAIAISSGYAGDPAFAALLDLGRWILGELERPPERIGLDG